MESLDKKIRDTLEILERMIEEEKDKKTINEQRKLLDKLLDEYMKHLRNESDIKYNNIRK